MCDALIYLLDNIYIRFGIKLYKQIVGIPMGTNCAPLVADLFLFCYGRDFLTALSDVKHAEIIEVFNSTSRYLDDLLNIDNSDFEGIFDRVYPPELQLNKANISDTEAPFLDKSFTAKLLQQGYRYHKLRKTFSKFYRRHYEIQCWIKNNFASS